MNRARRKSASGDEAEYKKATAGTREMTGSARWLMPILVALLTFAAFLPAVHNGFVDWDDDKNFLENPRYRGLGWTQLRWMFTTFHEGHYQPLSWLTLGVDYVVWGMDPFGYHLTNLILHAANAMLFYFLALQLLRPAVPVGSDRELRVFPISAAFAALIFAIHPLRVESVAWVTERRDVLSGLFFLLTIVCYLKANRVAETRPFRLRWMVATFVVYLFCLFSKAIGIILPIILLLIDVHPLARLRRGPATWFGPATRPVWWEKVPFLFVAIAFGVVAILAQQENLAFKPLQHYGFTPRVAQVIFGSAFYVWKTIVPFGLSPLYQLPEGLQLWDWSVALSGLMIVAVSAGLFRVRQRWPAGLAIWVYYLVVLAPVSGIAQSGVQVAADRYTYLSCLGWAILAGAGLLYVWRLWITGKIRFRTIFLTNGLAIMGLLVLTTLTWRQIAVWRDSETLWRHVLAVEPKASVAHNNLGTVLYRRGELEKAIGHYRRALEIGSDAVAYNNLGNALAKQGRMAEAEQSFLSAVRLKPDFAEAYSNLGNLFATQGKLEEAARQYRRAVGADPNAVGAHHSLAVALAHQGKLAEAIPHFRKAIELSPQSADIYLNLGAALAKEGRLDEAIGSFQQLLVIKPDFVPAYYNLGTIMAAKGDLKQAVDYFRHALQIDPTHVNSHFNLANILAREGRLQEAIDHFRTALKLKPDFAEAYHRLGRVLAGQGDLDRAIDYFRQALRLQPEFAEAHESLGRALALKGKTKEAAQHYREALRILKSRKKVGAG